MDQRINTGYADRFLWTYWWTCISNKKTSNYKTVHQYRPSCTLYVSALLCHLQECTISGCYYKFYNITLVTEFNNFPTRCDLFSSLHFCRQLYMFQVLTPIRSWYSCNYSFWYWLTGSTTVRFRCWVGTDSWLSSNSTTKADCSRSG